MFRFTLTEPMRWPGGCTSPGAVTSPVSRPSDTTITENLGSDPAINNNQDVAAANRLGKKGVDRHTVSFDADPFSTKRF